MIISNAFSLNMFQPSTYHIQITPVEQKDISFLLGETFESVVGHQDTANMFSNLLGINVECSRKDVLFDNESEAPQSMIVGQYSGPRLAEGTTCLPDGAKIVWWLVEF